MPVTPKDRVKDTTTSTGTGNLTLSGTAPTGFVNFNTAFGTGSANKFQYVIDSSGGSEWEVGIGYLSASTTLVRETILASSTGSAVSFSAGTKNVRCTIAAAGLPLARLQAADLTRNDSTTPTDSDLFVSVMPGKYKFHAELHIDNSACFSASAHCDFTGTATVSNLLGKRHWFGAYANTGTMSKLTSAATDLEVCGVEQESYADISGGVEFSTAGTFGVRFFQSEAEAENTILKRGSTLVLIPAN